ESQSVSDPGKKQNGEREEQKEIEGVWKPIAPALNPVEHASKETFSTWNFRHVSTQLLFRSQAVKKKVAQRMTVLLGVVLSAAKHLYDEQSMIEDPLV
ncbi:MAG TPA: hypothetical protein VM783_16100, partial [Candidatus Acidoferrum sp.]|nr:hypothetical protein [Candidatus Acidoferrum sp.]